MIDLIDRVDSLASVGSSNWQGGMTAVQHSLGLGHRRIARLGRSCLVDDARFTATWLPSVTRVWTSTRPSSAGPTSGSHRL